MRRIPFSGAAEVVGGDPLQARLSADLAPTSLHVVDLLPRRIAGREDGVELVGRHHATTAAKEQRRVLRQIDGAGSCEHLPVRPPTRLGLDGGADLEGARVPG